MLDLNNPEEAAFIEKMHEFNRQPNHCISFSYVVRHPDTGVPASVEMKNRPCYGELRAYGKDSTRPEDHKPGDLPSPMNVVGKGLREAVSVFIGRTSNDRATHNDFIEHLWSDKSPWIRGIGAHEFTRDKDDRIIGVVMWETDVDPTVMVSLFMFMRMCRAGEGGRAGRWKQLMDDHGCDANTAIIVSIWNTFSADGTKFYPAFSASYFLPVRLDIPGFRSGKSRDVSNGRTWRDGEDYNRPALQDVFMDENKDAPVTTGMFSDIIGAAKTPYAAPSIPIEQIKPIIEKLAA